jgi:hypothetical protein
VFAENPQPQFDRQWCLRGKKDMSEPPTYPVAKDFDEEKMLREVIDALRADNARLLRLLIRAFVSDGRPQHKELIEALAHHPDLRNWWGPTECLDGNRNEVRQRQDNDQSSPEATTIKAQHKRGRRAKRKKK